MKDVDVKISVRVLLSITLFFVSISSLMAEEKTHLVVTNAWTGTIKVSEGRIIKRVKELNANEHLDWVIAIGIGWLQVEYKKNGVWTPVLGCVRSSYPESVYITITPLSSDASQPMCWVNS